MDPNDPRHGTYRGAQTHWRDNEEACPSCRAAVRRYQKRRKIDSDRNIQRKVSTIKARRHIVELVHAGMTDGTIAKAAGVSLTAIRDTRIGRHPKMLRATADAILGVKVAPGATGYVDDIGSRRRIQALAALGWPKSAIVAAARKAGHPELTQAVLSWVSQGRAVDGRVTVRTRDGIAAAYGELSMTIPPQGRSARVVRGHAKRNGYAPPLAWDNIDDPEESPRRERDVYASPQHYYDEAVVIRILAGDFTLRASVAERREVVRRWPGTHNELERLAGWKVERYIDRGDVA